MIFKKDCKGPPPEPKEGEKFAKEANRRFNHALDELESILKNDLSVQPTTGKHGRSGSDS